MRRKYTLDQLRAMLVGHQWSQFKRPKAYKYCRVLYTNGVFFTLRPRMFLLRPALEIRADFRTVVLQLISRKDFEEVKCYLHMNHQWWSARMAHLGYIRVEDNEPVEAAQDIA